MAGSPYEGLDQRAYWRTAVASRGPGRLRGLYDPRFVITPQTRLMTAGSCFAQHVHRELKGAGFAVIDAEPAPEGIDPAVSAQFCYGLFSARYGNIYNPRQFQQLLREAGGQTRAHPVWTRDGRFFDAQRPNVDPGGYETADAVRLARADHLAAVSRALMQVQVVVFTMGLTETWEDRASGTVYPTAPGVIADAPDGAEIGLLCLRHNDIVADMQAVMAELRSVNPDIRMVLTVAPGPLIATAAGGHVLVASTACKAILRAAADTLVAQDPGIDYFPSYEIITNPAAKGSFFLPNLRNPTPKGVSVVMKQFLAAHQAVAAALPPAPLAKLEDDSDDDNELICEELLNDPGLGKGRRA
jgi:hypothetical protein